MNAIGAETIGPVARTYHDESDLRELRRELLDPLTLLVALVAFAVVAGAVFDPNADLVRIWLVALPLLITAGLGHFRRFGTGFASALIVGGLGLSIVGAAIVYPEARLISGLPLVVFAASVLLGVRGTLLTAGGVSVAALGLESAGVSAASEVPATTLLLFIWSAAGLAALASRPTRTALDWAWRNFELALERTEVLRDKQAELSRVAKSLTESFIQLEEVNWELARAKRAAEDARRLKAEFAAMLSHELRTPINLVIGFSEMVLDSPEAYGSPLPAAYRQDLEAIHRNALHITRLVGDVLDLSQIDAHRLGMERAPTSVGEVVAEAAENLAAYYRRLGLALDVDVPPDLPPINVDANRIRQVLVNLLNNAARFTDRGGVTVRAERDADGVIISVADSGTGIAPEDIPFVFDDFHQVGGSDRRRGGSGLGLAICRRIAELHGGYMSVTSEVGQGSTFRLSLPLVGSVISHPYASVPMPRVIEGGIVALLDDEPESAAIFRRYLDGYEVLWARNTTELQHLVTSRPVGAVIFTHEADADRWLDTARERHQMSDMPVFACPLNTPRALSERLGVAAYIVKPFGRERLIGEVRRLGRGVREIIIADDDPDLSRLLEQLLRGVSRRYRIRHAADGVAALALAREVRPDLLILDLQMPLLDGQGVLEAMRADPRFEGTRVIVVTGRGTAEESVKPSALALRKAGGLGIGEMMECLRVSLDSLRRIEPDNGQSPHEGSSG